MDSGLKFVDQNHLVLASGKPGLQEVKVTDGYIIKPGSVPGPSKPSCSFSPKPEKQVDKIKRTKIFQSNIFSEKR